MFLRLYRTSLVCGVICVKTPADTCRLAAADCWSMTADDPATQGAAPPRNDEPNNDVGPSNGTSTQHMNSANMHASTHTHTHASHRQMNTTFQYAMSIQQLKLNHFITGKIFINSVRPILRIGEYSLVALQHRRIRYIGLRVSADAE